MEPEFWLLALCKVIAVSCADGKVFLYWCLPQQAGLFTLQPGAVIQVSYLLAGKCSFVVKWRKLWIWTEPNKELRLSKLVGEEDCYKSLNVSFFNWRQLEANWTKSQFIQLKINKWNITFHFGSGKMLPSAQKEVFCCRDNILCFRSTQGNSSFLPPSLWFSYWIKQSIIQADLICIW